jgi:hypothetical protein
MLIHSLLQKLATAAPENRASIVEEIVAIGAPAAEPVRVALSVADPQLRVWHVEALKRLDQLTSSEPSM